MTNKLRLYVWEDVLTGYTSGVMFALAESVEAARNMIIEAYSEQGGDELKKDLECEPDVYEKPFGFALWGGG